MTRLILLLIFFGSSHLALEAKACTCAPRASVYQEYQLASAIFVGKATGSRDVKESAGSTERIFQFSVSEAFKGVRRAN